MDLRNLTPHEVTIRVGDDESPTAVVTLPPSGVVARAEELVREDDPVTITIISDDGQSLSPIHIPVIEVAYGAPVDLPDPEPGVGFVVSHITVEAARQAGRTTSDLYTTTDLVRDDAGRVVACRALARH
jgi:hypothetical protein